MPSTDPWRRRVATVVAAVLAPALAGLLGAAPAHASDAGTGAVVLLGTTGVTWADVTATTPGLVGLADEAAIGNAAVRSVRSTACPADGWLAVSTGTRAADLPHPGGVCRVLGDPAPTVPGWSDFVAAAADDEYAARPGRLGDLLAARHVRVVAFGPGAAIVTARSDGLPTGSWSALPTTDDLRGSVADALDGGARLVVVDLGSVTTRGAETVAQVDARLSAALAGVADAGGDPTVLVASLADAGSTPQLQLAAARGPGLDATLLTSAATHQAGIVLGTDVGATVADALGLPTDGFAGSPVTSTATAPVDRTAAVTDVARHAAVARPLVSAFYLALVALNVALCAGVLLGLARAPRRRAATGVTTPAVERRRVRTLRAVRAYALAVGAVPVALLLANLLPWWRAGTPAAALAGTAAVIVLAVVAVALLGPWRRSALGSAGVVAAVTAAAVVGDVATGARLQLSAVIGVPTLDAGRFYGVNNTAFALAAAASLTVAAAVADPLLRAGRRRAAVLAVVVVGAALTVLDGAPGIGADFGGPPALIPAFAVLALLVGGARVTWRRLLAVLAGAVAVTVAFALADWRRPAAHRTHLGQLVQTVLDGGLWPVLQRKLSTNLHVVAHSLALTLVTLVAVGLVLVLAVRPVRAALTAPDGGRYGALSRGTRLAVVAHDVPALPAWLAASGTAFVIGFAVNDSGIAIPAIGLAITVPLLVATMATWLRRLPAAAADRPVPGPVVRLGGAGSEPADRPADRPADDRSGHRPPDRPDRGLGGTRAAGGSGHAPRTRTRARRAVAVLAGALALVGLGAPAADATPGAASSGSGAAASTAPVVLIGVGGLRWSDVGVLTSPALWTLSRTAAVGQVVVRSVHARTCPTDGWLAVSSGERAADAEHPDGCRTLVEPTATSATTAAVPDWADYLTAVAHQAYDAKLGLLGDALAGGGVPSTAIGPGAAIALARADGSTAGGYVARPAAPHDLTATVRTALGSSRLVVVDAGTVRDPGFAAVDPDPAATGSTDTDQPGTSGAILGPSRADQVSVVDARVGAVLDATAGTGATVLVVSLADSGASALRLAAVTGRLPGTATAAAGLLTSASTRQHGLLLGTDVTPTLLTALGLPVGDLSGTAIESVPGPATATARLAALADDDRLATEITLLSTGFTDRWLLAQVLLAGLAALLLPWSGAGPWAGPARLLLRPGLRGLRGLGLALGAVPVASFLTRTVPWWRSGLPHVAFWGVLTGWVALICALALLGPWRRSRVGPPAVVAAVTLVVIGVDAALGGRLVVDSPLGAHRLLGARFYGVSNQSFALLAVAGLIVGGVAARELIARGRPSAAGLAVAGIGLAALVVDAMPTMGADFGGPPALLPAFGLLAVVVSGRRVRWRTVLLVLAAAAVFVVGVALLDYSRPADARTHLGRFVATVVDGGLWPVVSRKLGTSLRLLGSPRYDLPMLAGTAVTWAVVGGPGRDRRPRGELAALPDDEPLVRPVAAAIAIAMLLGFAVNDSGIVIPATGLALAVPCLVALAAAWRTQRLSPLPGPAAAPAPGRSGRPATGVTRPQGSAA